MTERGIIFSYDSVRAILEGYKTQTRRLIRPQFVECPETILVPSGWWAYGPTTRRSDDAIVCPYGKPRDRLWVRETWGMWPAPTDDEQQFIYQAACDAYPAGWPSDMGPIWDYVRWRSPRYMPRRASRLTLEITDVRCEQLQDITIEDCRAEGFRGLTDIGWRYVFGSVWNQFHEKHGYGWNVNPWVWVISFRRMDETRRTD